MRPVGYALLVGVGVLFAAVGPSYPPQHYRLLDPLSLGEVEVAGHLGVDGGVSVQGDISATGTLNVTGINTTWLWCSSGNVSDCGTVVWYTDELWVDYRGVYGTAASNVTVSGQGGAAYVAAAGTATSALPLTLSGRADGGVILVGPVTADTIVVDGGVTAANVQTPDVTLETTAALNLVVDPAGSDSNDCTAESPCQTFEAACRKVPLRVLDPVTITAAAGTYSAGCHLDGRALGQRAGVGATITIQGTEVDATLSSGTARGTFTSVVNATAPAWSSGTDSGQSWTPDALKGLLVEIVAGTGSGQMAVIQGNTATSFTIAGQWSPALDTSSQYAIRTSGTTINGNLTNSVLTNINAFVISGMPEMYQSSVGIVLQKLRFVAGVANAVGVWSSTVSLKYNQFASISGTGIRLNGNAGVFAQWNSWTGAGSFLTSSTGTYTRTLFATNNYVSVSGTGYAVGLSGLVGNLQLRNNWCQSNAGAPACVRTDAVLDGQVSYDRYTSGVYCMRFSFGNSGMVLGKLAVDGIQCNDPVTGIFGVAGPLTLHVDQNLSVASTGTNTNAAPWYRITDGGHVRQSSITAFGAANAEIVFGDTVGGPNYKMTAARVLTPRVIRAGASTWEEGGATDAQPGFAGGSVLAPGGVGGVYSCALTPPVLVYFASSSSVAAADPADATKPAEGVAVSSPSVGACFVVTSGAINLAGLTSGVRHFLGTGGTVTATPPSATGAVVQDVGRATSATTLVFAPGPVIQLR